MDPLNIPQWIDQSADSGKRAFRQAIYTLITAIAKSDMLQDKMIIREIFFALIGKAKSRDLAIDQASMVNENIMERSRAEYSTLAQEIEGELPPFDKVYGRVKEYYESLPWKALSFLLE